MDNKGNKKRVTNLGSLYPQPKSYTQLERERLQRQLVRQSRESPYEPLRLSGGLAVLFALAYLIGTHLDTVLLLGLIAGVFFCFLLGLLLAGGVYLSLGAIRAFFDRKGYSPSFVFAAWVIQAVALVYALSLTPLAFTPIAALLFGVTMYVLICVTIMVVVGAAGLKTKLAITISTTAIAITIAIAASFMFS